MPPTLRMEPRCDAISPSGFMSGLISGLMSGLIQVRSRIAVVAARFKTGESDPTFLSLLQCCGSLGANPRIQAHAKILISSTLRLVTLLIRSTDQHWHRWSSKLAAGVPLCICFELCILLLWSRAKMVCKETASGMSVGFSSRRPRECGGDGLVSERCLYSFSAATCFFPYLILPKYLRTITGGWKVLMILPQKLILRSVSNR